MKLLWLRRLLRKLRRRPRCHALQVTNDPTIWRGTQSYWEVIGKQRNEILDDIPWQAGAAAPGTEIRRTELPATQWHEDSE